jgi:hypothetical protein
MSSYNGFYVGLVIQNNDPEKRGRVKVFIPHLNSHVVSEWLKKEGEKELEDVEFVSLDLALNPAIQRILPKLKDTLPWAEYAGAIFGGNSSSRYNDSTKKAYTENHNQWNKKEPAFKHRPASGFSNANPPKDGFDDHLKVKQTNPYAYAYDASDYSTLASGSFSIPNVGANVWCFFESGDINCPVFFAAAYGQEDIKRIFTQEKHTIESVRQKLGEEAAKMGGSVDYPGAYENIEDPDFKNDAQTFRGKHVINSNKHSIEMVDTDKRETLKLTHYSGSFKEFNNKTTIEFSPNNDQKLVIGDQFETINSNKNVRVGEDFREYIDGDREEHIGTFNTDVTGKIKDILVDIHQYFQLFDVRRTKLYNETGASSLPNFVSPLQTREKAKTPIKANTSTKGFVSCPICKSKNYSFDSAGYLLGLQQSPLIFSPPKLAGPLFSCKTPEFVLQIGASQPSYVLTFPIPTQLDLDLLVTLQGLTLKGKGYFAGAKCDICNSDLLFTPDQEVGYSPSTHNGEFEPEHFKEAGGELDKKIQSSAPELLRLQRQLSGGDKISNISKNKIETIGTVMNDLPSIRVDPIGKLRSENVYIAPESVYISYAPAPHIEHVSVLNVPGGDYILTAMNKYKLLVGANGINMKTFGPIDMYGTLFNITGQQINISSQYEINIDGGDRFSLRGRKIAFHPKEHSPVMVDGSLHISRNAIIQGGLHVDGQFSTPAIASIREYGETSDGIWSLPGVSVNPTELNDVGDANAEQVLSATGYSYIACGWTAPIPPLFKFGVPVNVLIPPHTHLYERPPSQLFNSIQALRAFISDPSGKPTRSGGNGASINDVQRTVAAAPVNDIAIGEDKIPVVGYAAILRTRILDKLSTDPAVTAVGVGSLTITTAEKDSSGEVVNGQLSINIKRTHDGTPVQSTSRWNTYTYTITYSIFINPEEKTYKSEKEDPTFVVTAQRGFENDVAAANPPPLW